MVMVNSSSSSSSILFNSDNALPGITIFKSSCELIGILLRANLYPSNATKEPNSRLKQIFRHTK